MGACPGNEESAGVNYSHRCPKGNRQMRRVLNQADGSTGSLRSRRSRRYYDALIFMAFRGPQAQVNQLRKSSRLVSQSPVSLPFANTSNGLA
jgi:hypothetical protein